MDEVTLWRNSDPAELAKALQIDWRTWLCQLGMTDDNFTIDVITTALQKDESTDAQSMHPEWKRSPRPITMRQAILMRRKNDASKAEGECVGESQRPHRTCGDGGPKFEDDDSRRHDKGADTTEWNRASKFESPKNRLSPRSCGGWHRTHPRC